VAAGGTLWKTLMIHSIGYGADPRVRIIEWLP
jgi:hypothetical protein